MSENTDTQIVTTKTPVAFGKAGVLLATMEDAYRFALAVSKSGFAPKGIETPEAIMIAVQFGAELGLTPMASLQSLAVVNGRPSIYGDAALALVRGSGYLESYKQSTAGEGEAMTATVTVKRKDEDAITSSFSVADAKKAGLWGKAGPWTNYPGRMLMWRARGFALRDAFGDVLRGLATTEEVLDLPPIKDVTPAPRAKVPKEQPKLSDASPSNSSTEGRATPAATTEGADAVSDGAAGTQKTEEKSDSVSGNQAPPVADSASAMKLEVMISEAGFKFADFVPTLHGSRLCARNAAELDDMTAQNQDKFLSNFAEIVKAVEAEKAP